MTTFSVVSTTDSYTCHHSIFDTIIVARLHPPPFSPYALLTSDLWRKQPIRVYNNILSPSCVFLASHGIWHRQESDLNSTLRQLWIGEPDDGQIDSTAPTPRNRPSGRPSDAKPPPLPPHTAIRFFQQQSMHQLGGMQHHEHQDISEGQQHHRPQQHKGGGETQLLSPNMGLSSKEWGLGEGEDEGKQPLFGCLPGASVDSLSFMVA